MYFVGLDLGQRQNYTAVAVERAGGSPQNAMGCHTLLLRHLKRMALGTAYRELWSAPAGGGRDGGWAHRWWNGRVARESAGRFRGRICFRD